MSTSQTILVTGATGFVGRRLCSHLAEHGHRVIALVRAGSRTIPGVAQEVRIADFAHLDALNTLLPQCDAVIHLAGRAHVMRDTAADPLGEFRRGNVGLTRSLLERAANARVKRFVFISSIGVNGNSNITPFSKKDTPAPHDLYAISKLEAERLVQDVAQQYGMEYAIVRLVLVFVPEAPGNFGTLLKLAAKGRPLPFGRLQSKRSLISLWNLADFLRACATCPQAQHDVFLAAGAQTVTLPEIFRHLAIGMGKSARMLAIPRSLLALACTLIGKRQMLDKLDAGLTVEIAKAQQQLAWQAPYTMAEALIKTGKVCTHTS